MAILGSRGRSALKGVLLGSFSNYIVTKSSVPVMVARRRYVFDSFSCSHIHLLHTCLSYIDNIKLLIYYDRLRKHAKQKLHKDGLPVAGTGDGRMRIGRMSNVLEAPGSSGRRVNRLSVAKVD